MKSLVTGGCGFFGSSLVKELAARGRKVKVFDIIPPQKSDFGKEIEFIQGDITNIDDCIKAIDDVDEIYHTVSLVPVTKRSNEFEKVNAEGTFTILKAVQQENIKIKSFVHISSSAVYGVQKCPITEKSSFHPLGLYGMSKLKAEEHCQKFRNKINICIIRPRTILGEGRLGIIQVFFDWILSGRRIYLFGNGNEKYQFVSTRDLISACILAAEKRKNTDYNIGSARFFTMRDLLQYVIDENKSRSKLVSLPAKPLRNILKLLDKVNLSPLADWHYQTLGKDFYFDISKAKKELGWNPLDDDKTSLNESYKWYLKEGRFIGKSGSAHRTNPKQGILTILKKMS